MDFTPVKEAKITQGELANICDVSRVTANKWLNGGGVHPLLTKKISAILMATKLAVGGKHLPLPPDTPRENRKQLIRTVIARHLATVRAAKAAE